jgi:aspartyl-tRNA(Asn)/glutamyl-tRNA(Gln) amidotransferase subunit C
MQLKRRKDAVSDGGIRDQVLANAPESANGFFVVPKVVE